MIKTLGYSSAVVLGGLLCLVQLSLIPKLVLPFNAEAIGFDAAFCLISFGGYKLIRYGLKGLRTPKASVLVLLLGLFLAPHAFAQQHAPTAAQCQADAAVWGNLQDRTAYNQAETAHVIEGTPNRTTINLLPNTEIEARMSEMIACIDVDPSGFRDYYDVQNFYHCVTADRWVSFLHRHHLIAQFKAEDKAGAR